MTAIIIQMIFVTFVVTCLVVVLVITTTKHTLRKDTKLYEAYKQYFNIEVEHQDKQWVPHYACHNCTRRLHGTVFNLE